MGPATTLRERLAAARRGGATFDVAWTHALAVTLRAVDRAERQDWADVLAATVDVWRDAWLRRPPRHAELALVAVAMDPDRRPMPDRECARCSGAIPDDRPRNCGRQWLYCSQECANAAKRDRERSRAAAS